MDKISKIIQERAGKTARKMRERHMFGGRVFVLVSDDLPKNFNLDFVLRKFEELVPEHLVYGLDGIYVGNFKFLNDKNYTATYRDSVIYVTNEQTSEKEMIEDLVHEVSHMVEEESEAEIYDDRAIENEFLKKRRALLSVLNSNGFQPPPIVMKQPEYNPYLDKFFMKTVGYPMLTTLVNGIFNSPYAATSLREYFARGFEQFVMGDRNSLRKVSPVLYSKLEELMYSDEV